ncbi:DUF6691 family protein [Roseibium aestuarii]|uniref:DUF6691 family protein n=1 Tax=Roseibium aestuarii TaxID=2600299 RepID=A0ABW4JT81_9HYPH|nr:DUF6691 family protein [Roseibium aestuarii]
MRALLALLAGLVFGAGIALAGMINPAKVLNFFDVAGTWDPSLAFVMGGAIVVTFIGYRLAWRRTAPLLDTRFHLPTAQTIDLRLVGGAAIFGVGWGIAGFCPGGAIPALGLGRVEPLVFVGAMIVGILVARTARNAATRKASLA